MGDARLILIGTRTVREVGERVGDDDGLRGGEPEVRALGPVGGGRYCFDEEGDDEDGVEGGGIVEPGTTSALAPPKWGRAQMIRRMMAIGYGFSSI